MAVPIDYTSDVGKVRLLISDVDADNVAFEDDDLQAFLDIEGGDVRLAAAQALETLASNEALLYKKIRVDGVSQVDGPAVAQSLLNRAAVLRERADQDGTFDIAAGPCPVPEMAEWPIGELYQWGI